MKIENQSTETSVSSWTRPKTRSLPVESESPGYEVESGSPWVGLMSECRDMALEFSNEQLGNLFNHTDTAFLDFAEKAESNQLQGLFFEAMYEVRNKRRLVVQSFLDQLRTGFDRFGRGDRTSRDEGDGTREKLSLVPWEEMDESVATENMIARARQDFQEELYALVKRLEVVNGGQEIKDEAIPSGPWQLVSSFRKALREVSTEAKVKLILYAMFEKFVLKEANGIYSVFNGNLIENGILPELRPTIVTQQEESGRVRPDTASATPPHRKNTDHTESNEVMPRERGTESLGEELFQTVLGLMAAHRSREGAPQALPANTLPREVLESVVDAIQPVYRGASGIEGAGAEVGGAEGSVGPGESEGSGAAVAAVRAGDGRRARGLGDAVPARGEGKSALAGGAPDAGEGDGATAGSVRGAGEAAGGRTSAAVGAPADLASAGRVTEDDLVPDIELDEAFLEKVRMALSEERKRVFKRIDRNRMNVADADTIDLVGMLFEYMLIDPLLPNLAKALISRLHTPYLKVAIRDLRMRTDYEHPARRLLDELVEAGGKWVHENDRKRGIFPAMQLTVLRVLTEFTDNVELFDELLSDFREAMEERRRKTEVIERRAREAAKGRERLEVAKQRAAQEMKARVEHHRVPQPVAVFLTRVWTERLKFILLRNPDRELSADWQEALKIADTLVRLFDQDTPSSERDAMIGGLRKAIGSGLGSVGSAPKEACDALFDLLDDPEAVSAELAKPPTGSDSPSAPTLEGMPPDEEPEQASVESSPELEAMVRHLRELEYGTWFQFRDDRGGKPRRLKLSWLSPVTATCLFVDPAGVQAAVKSLRVLAREVLDGRATEIEQPQEPFVRRTLKKIYSVLQLRTDL